VIVAVVSAIMGFMQTRSTDERWSLGDQSLDTLDVFNGDRSGSVAMPGGKKSSRSDKWTSPESMLYQAPGGSQVESVSAGSESSAEKLLDDLGRASAMGKKPADASGWNGEAARTGLSANSGGAGATSARPTLAPMNGGFASSNSGTSAGNFFAGSTPFGVGKSQPGEARAAGSPASAEPGIGRGGNQSLLALRRVAGTMGNARTAHDMERMWGHTAGSFDGAGAYSTLAGGGTSDSGIGTGSGVPANLKGDVNSNDIQKKDIQPPPPVTPAPVDNSSIQNRQLMMIAAGLLAAGLVAVVMKSLTSSPTDQKPQPAFDSACPGGKCTGPTPGATNRVPAS